MTELDILTSIANSNHSILYAINILLVLFVVLIIFALFALVFKIFWR